uniref:RNA-directed DNA polymerase n=1 Tax=Steinernema glaseri TaxID=37863 RepID=A0A1I7YGE5_9BILA
MNKILEKYSPFLCCPICKKLMEEPVQLPRCAHSMCYLCLTDLVSNALGEKEGYIDCPQYISHFAQKAKPLYDLLKGNPLKLPAWRKDHQIAFETLKSAIITAPVLCAPIPNRPFTIETDASATALAACLLQEHEGESKPVAYASRILNKHEKSYPSVETEALAIIFALKEFRPYIEGNGLTTVRTDNQALSFLLKKKRLPPRLTRFQLIIQTYNVKITHRPGSTNKLCDYLSRYPYLRDTLEGTPVEVYAIDSTPSNAIDLARVREAQKNDVRIRDIYDFLNGKITTSHERNVEAKYIIVNKCVYLKGDEEFPDHRLLIPYPLRADLIMQFHSDPLNGAHLGAAKIANQLISRVYWPGLKMDTTSVIKSCPTCQARKTHPSHVPTEPLYQPQLPTEPFEHIHTDILGPLPKTPAGNVYILTAVDSLSKFAFALPIPDQTARTVALALLRNVFTKFGFPKRLTSDQGRQYVSDLFETLMGFGAIRHITTSAYHPQANGLAEGLNKVIANSLSAYVSSTGNDWDEYIDLTMFALNSSIHSSTRDSPFHMMFLRDARLPVDDALQIPRQTRPSLADGTVRAQLRKQIRLAWSTARTFCQLARERQKHYYDLNHNTDDHDIQVGDLVLIKREYLPRDQLHKFAPKWVGPKRVIKVFPPNATLLDLSSQKLTNVHLNRLKVYVDSVVLPLRSADHDKTAPISSSLTHSDDDIEDHEVASHPPIGVDQ